MRRIRVLICSVDEELPDEMTELAAFDLPTTDVTALRPETALDDLETTTQETGNAILRRVLQAQWATIDAQLTEDHRQRFSPSPHHTMAGSSTGSSVRSFRSWQLDPTLIRARGTGEAARRSWQRSSTDCADRRRRMGTSRMRRMQVEMPAYGLGRIFRTIRAPAYLYRAKTPSNHHSPVNNPAGLIVKNHTGIFSWIDRHIFRTIRALG